MSNEEVKVEVTAANSEAKYKGPRGELGTATPSLTIKQLWYASKSKGHVSLKEFARAQAKDGNQTATDWLGNKAGRLNQKRSDKNLQRIAAEKSASRAARRKGKK